MSWSELGIDLKGRTSGKAKLKCPKCSHTRKKKNDPCLYVDIDSGTYQCYNCEFKGNAGEKRHSRTMKKEYTIPVFNNKTDLPKKIVDYFLGRGISQQVLKEMKITYSEEWMPQTKQKEGTIQFNYFKNGKLVNTKYRDGSKNFKMRSGAELLLYNIDAIKDSEECLIAEGEICQLSWLQAGYKFATSVPNGASKGSANMEYLTNSIEWLKNKKKVYIATDNDDAGEWLRDELVKRIGKDKCYVINYPKEGGVKDANDYLKAKGGEALMSLMSQAKGFPIEGIYKVDDIREKLMEKWGGTIPQEAESCHFRALEPHWGWNKGEINVVFGGGNMGKSSFVNELCQLKSIHDKDVWGYYSPENHPAEDFFNDFAKRQIGRQKFWEEEQSVYIDALNFVNDHFLFLFSDKEAHTPDFILEKFKEAIVKYGITGIIIDPFNQVENPNTSVRDDKYIGAFLRKLKKFVVVHDLFCIVVVHTSTIKEKPNGELEMPHMYNSIEGGGIWNKSCDNVMCYHRPMMKLDPRDNTAMVEVQKIKKKFKTGLPGTIEVTYNLDTNRFYDDMNQSAFGDTFSYNPYGGFDGATGDLFDTTGGKEIGENVPF
jgi:twinkle protein